VLDLAGSHPHIVKPAFGGTLDRRESSKIRLAAHRLL
jgi:hypothetical protein